MPLKVLLATPYDLAVPSGANRQPLGLLDVLAARGLEVRLVGPSSDPSPPRDPRVMALGRPFRVPLNGAESQVTFDFRILAGLRALVREFQPDVVHVQEPVVPLPSAALLWLVPRDALRVGTFHTYSESSLGYLLAWPWVRAVWSRLHLRVAVSESAREFATRYHRAEFSIIPNAIALPATTTPPRSAPGTLRVLFVGRLGEPRKGFASLIEAVRQVEARGPGTLTLTAIGRGVEAWQATAAGLPLTLRGEVSDLELAAAYDAADLVVAPSTHGESFGIVPLEAMAHRRPVLATRIAGYSAWMEGAAHLVAPGDPGALAEALAALAADPARRRELAERGAALAAAHSWDAIGSRWLALYQGRGP